MSFGRKYLSGLIEISSAWLINCFISGSLIPIGEVTLGSEERMFSSFYAKSLFNRYGKMLVNDVTSSAPLGVEFYEGSVKVTLDHDTTLHIDDGKLSVNTDPSDFQLDDDNGVLQLVPSVYKGVGAIRIQTSESSDWSDFLLEDIDVSIKKLRVVKLKTSSFFTQTNGTLGVSPNTPGCVPFFSSSDPPLDTSNNLKFDGAQTLTVGYIKLLNPSLQLPDDYVPSRKYLSQFYQSSENSAIDIEAEVQGSNRRIIKSRVDGATIVISNTNKLEVCTKYREPLFFEKDTTGSEVHLKFDGKSLKLNAQKELSFGLSGNGIALDFNTGNISVKHDSTLKFVGSELSLNLIVNDPITLTNGNTVGLSLDSSLEVVNGKLSAKSVLVDNVTVGWDAQNKLRGLYSFGAGLQVGATKDQVSAVFQTAEYPLKVSNGNLRLWYDNTLTTDGAGNLSVKPVLVDNYTIIKRNDLTFQDGALKMNMQGGLGITISGNTISGAYSAGTGLILTGSSFSLNPSIETRLNTHEGRISALEGRVSAHDGLLTSLQTQATAALSSIGVLTSGLAANVAATVSANSIATAAQATGVLNSTAITGLTSGLAGAVATGVTNSSAIVGLTAASSLAAANIIMLDSIAVAHTGAIGTLTAANITNSAAILTNTSGLGALSIAHAGTAAGLITTNGIVAGLSTAQGVTASSLATSIGVQSGMLTNMALIDSIVSVHTANLLAVDSTLISLSSGVAGAVSLGTSALAEASTSLSIAVGAESTAVSALGIGSSALALSSSNAALLALMLLGKAAGGTSFRSEIDDLYFYTNELQDGKFRGGNMASTWWTAGNFVSLANTSVITSVGTLSKLDVSGVLTVGIPGSQKNMIRFAGTQGDANTNLTDNNSCIVNRLVSGSETSELLLFSGNDIAGGPGPDSIRLMAAEVYVDLYASAGSYNFESNSPPPANRKLIITQTQATFANSVFVGSNRLATEVFVTSTYQTLSGMSNFYTKAQSDALYPTLANFNTLNTLATSLFSNAYIEQQFLLRRTDTQMDNYLASWATKTFLSLNHYTKTESDSKYQVKINNGSFLYWSGNALSVDTNFIAEKSWVSANFTPTNAGFLEIGSWTSDSPCYIDLHSRAGSGDFDARIIKHGGTASSLEFWNPGAPIIIAGSQLIVSSQLDVTGSVVCRAGNSTGITGANPTGKGLVVLPGTNPWGVAVSIDASPLTGGKDWWLFSTGGVAGEGPGKLIIRNNTTGGGDITFENGGMSVATNVNAPTAPTLGGHLCNKTYVDSLVPSAGSGLTKTGNVLSVNASQNQITSVGTLSSLVVTGNIVNNSSPLIASHVVTRGYTDSLSYLTAGTGLTKTSGTLAVNAAQPQITSVGTLTALTITGAVVNNFTPTLGTHLVNKSYADSTFQVKFNVATGLLWGANNTVQIDTSLIADRAWVSSQNYVNSSIINGLVNDSHLVTNYYNKTQSDAKYLTTANTTTITSVGNLTGLIVDTSNELILARTGGTYLFIQSIAQNRIRIGGYDGTIANYRPIYIESPLYTSALFLGGLPVLTTASLTSYYNKGEADARFMQSNGTLSNMLVTQGGKITFGGADPSGFVEADNNHSLYFRKSATGVINATALYAYSSIEFHCAEVGNASLQPTRVKIDSNGLLSAYNGLSVTGNTFINGQVDVTRSLDSGHAIILKNDFGGGNAHTLLALMNNTGNGGYLFINSSARSQDGGVNTLTLRNDIGNTRLMAGGNELRLNYNGTCEISSNTYVPWLNVYGSSTFIGSSQANQQGLWISWNVRKGGQGNSEYVSNGGGGNANHVFYNTWGAGTTLTEIGSIRSDGFYQGTNSKLATELFVTTKNYLTPTGWTGDVSFYTMEVGTNNLVADSSVNTQIRLRGRPVNGNTKTGLEITALWDAPNNGITGCGFSIHSYDTDNHFHAMDAMYSKTAGSFQASHPAPGLMYKIGSKLKFQFRSSAFWQSGAGYFQSWSPKSAMEINLENGDVSIGNLLLSDNYIRIGQGNIANKQGYLEFWSTTNNTRSAYISRQASTGGNMLYNNDGGTVNVPSDYQTWQNMYGSHRFLQTTSVENGALLLPSKIDYYVPNAAAVWYGTNTTNSMTAAGTYSVSLLANHSIICRMSLMVLSDARAKKDVQELDPIWCINALDKIKPVHYLMKSDDSRHFGFLSQNVQEVAQEPIVDLGGSLHLDHNQLISILWGSVKRLRQEVEELKQKSCQNKNG